MKKLLRLPLRIAALPLIAILLVFHLISSIIVGLTSIATNLLAVSSHTPFISGILRPECVGVFKQVLHRKNLLRVRSKCILFS